MRLLIREVTGRPTGCTIVLRASLCGIVMSVLVYAMKRSSVVVDYLSRRRNFAIFPNRAKRVCGRQVEDSNSLRGLEIVQNLAVVLALQHFYVSQFRQQLLTEVKFIG